MACTGRIQTRDMKWFNSSEDFSILTILHTNNLQMNDTMSYNGSLIVLCCLTCRSMFITQRFIFVINRGRNVTCRVQYFTHRFMKQICRIIFVTHRGWTVTYRLTKQTHRVQKFMCINKQEYVMFSIFSF